MNARQILKGSLLVTALLLSTFALAANKGSLQIYDTLSIAGKQLKPGTYNLKWDGDSGNVQLSIMKGKNVVATVPGKMITLPNAAQQDSAVVNHNPDGSNSLNEVRFSGKTYAIEVSSDAGSSGSSSGSN